MAALISILHVTRYRYDRPVIFGRHRLLVRPRDGHDLRVLASHLSITPASTVHWQFDTFGNSVANVVFSEKSDFLEIRSDLLIKRYARNATDTNIEHSSRRMPLTYSPDNLIDLAPYIPMQYPGERDELEKWLEQAFLDRPAEITEFLTTLSTVIHSTCTYSRREERGTQSAITTVIKGTGTCRDFAFLFMECARLFGFAARFVTGYLHVQDDPDDDGLRGGGSTHAWADVYVPGQGWLEFDPTNLIQGNQALIRIAVTRTPEQATPISGTFDQSEAEFLGMTVTVTVKEVQEEEEEE
jgi:transglutaminase-like putative cysteine protease